MRSSGKIQVTIYTLITPRNVKDRSTCFPEIFEIIQNILNQGYIYQEKFTDFKIL